MKHSGIDLHSNNNSIDKYCPQQSRRQMMYHDGRDELHDAGNQTKKRFPE